MTFRLFVLSLLLMPFGAFAGVPNLTVALQNTYRACVGIDDDLAEMKRMAGINTAITGVGTEMGVGATATGFAKAKLDKKNRRVGTCFEPKNSRTTKKWHGPKSNNIGICCFRIAGQL